jgi:nucleoside-diphosphate-sugar epimerase
MPRRVLVTGATGFVGRHCLRPLVERGFEVHGTSRSAYAVDGVAWHSCDLLDARARRSLLAEVAPSHLLHTAWYLEPGRYTSADVNLDWLVSSLDLVRRFQQSGGERVVVTGSCFEYEFGRRVYAESAPCRPATVYGACKHALGVAVGALADATALSSAWARLFFLYGPSEDPRRLIADIASSVALGRTVETGHGLNRRDYMFVNDAGAALSALLDSGVTGAVNVATGDAPPVREIVEAVANALGRPELVRYGARPTSPDDPAEIRADVSRLRDEVGWTDWTPMAEAVQVTAEWWRRNSSAVEV